MKKRVLSVLLCVAVFFTITACKKNPVDEDSDLSVIYTYTTIGGENQGKTDDTASGDGQQSGDLSNKSDKSSNKSNKSNKSGKSNGTGSTSSKKQTFEEVEDDLKSQVRNLKGRTITYVAYWADGNNTQKKKAIAATEKLLNCKFVHRYLADYKPLAASILAGNPICDIFATHYDSVPSMANKGMLTAISDLPSFDMSDEIWNKAVFTETKLNGKVYAITREKQWRDLLVYNKKMFAENSGWPDLYTKQKNGTLTWSDLETVMKGAAKVSSGQVTRYGLVPNRNMGRFASLLLNANGTTALRREGDSTKFTYQLNNSASTAALNKFAEWVKQPGYVYDYNKEGAAWDSGTKIFNSGKAAMCVVDPHHFNEVTSGCNFPIGLVMFPHGPNTTHDLVPYMVNAESIPAGVKNPDDVALFWDTYSKLFVVQEDNEDLYAMDESIEPTITKALRMLDNGDYIHDWTANEGSGSLAEITTYYDKVAKGEMSVAQMIKSVEQLIPSLANGFWND